MMSEGKYLRNTGPKMEKDDSFFFFFFFYIIAPLYMKSKNHFESEDAFLLFCQYASHFFL